MKIYTKAGDEGKTFLLSGCRVDKNDPLVVSYGKVDTLVSFLGFAKSSLKKLDSNVFNEIVFNEIIDILDEIQVLCFKAMTDIASSPSKTNFKNKTNTKKTKAKDTGKIKYERISLEDIKKIENHIDNLWASMPPLKNFVIPGNDIYSSILHICRSICREAEPFLTTANKKYNLNPFVLIFINRLSDLLFTLAVKIDYLINGKLELIKENKKIN